MEKHNFTEAQLNKIFEFVHWIHSGSSARQDVNFRIENFEQFKDNENNYYASYVLHGFEKGEPVSESKYVKIDTDGDKTILNDVYKTMTALTHKFDTLQKITF